MSDSMLIKQEDLQRRAAIKAYLNRMTVEVTSGRLSQVARFLQSLLDCNPPCLTPGQLRECELALANILDK